MVLAKIIFCLLIMLAFSVEARMYQWLDPDSGTTQLSGKPPYWYRSYESGPRIFVFENGRIIDDTAVELTEEHNLLMRQKAFSYVQELPLKEQATQNLEEEINQIEENAQEQELKVLRSSSTEEKTEESIENANTFMQMTMEQMRSLIQDWENTQTEKAKTIINN